MFRRIVGCLWIATLTIAPAAAQQPFTLEHFRKFVGVGGVELSPDGRTAVITVGRPNYDADKNETEL